MWQHRLEKIFIYKKTIFFIFLLITLAFAYSARNIKTDFDFSPNISSKQSSQLQKLFVADHYVSEKGHHAVVTIVIADHDLFSLNNIHLLKKLEQELLNTHVVANITSLHIS